MKITPHSVRWVALLAAFLYALDAAGSSAERHTLTAKVVGVHDGDSITVLTAAKEQLKVRLEGIDAPELKQPYGRAAKNALSDMVFGREVTLNVIGTDRYDRTLARVLVGEVDVNLQMVKLGLAWRYDKYSKEQALLDAQNAAKAAKTGLWAGADPVPPWEWRVNYTRHLFHEQ